MSFTSKLIVISVVTGFGTGVAAQTPSPDLTQYLIADRAAEVVLARSAAPRRISDSATVLVLTREGFVEAVRGTNGFVCLVHRAFAGPLTDVPSWSNTRIRAPHCLNAAAVRSVLPEMKERASLMMSGVPVKDIVARISRDYATRKFAAPESGAMAYMMSHDQYLNDDNPSWKPHVMFYYGGARNPSEWGAGGFDAPIIDGGSEKAAGINIILIPVPEWSDGTPFKGR
ncbi:MAG: hypothetical protein ACREMS_10475 [Gemmatimonadaceae bacterium]